MRASAKSTSPDPEDDPGQQVEVMVRRRLPRPVVWLLWLIGAMIGSVVLGFLAGLARPREPDPWAPGPPPYPPPPYPPPDAPSPIARPTGAEDE